MDDLATLKAEAAAFRRLLQHLDAHKEVQNIDLMNLAGFCRNCLAKWYAAAATEQGLSVDFEATRERRHGLPSADLTTPFHKRLGLGR